MDTFTGSDLDGLRQWLRRQAGRLTADADEAEDLVQDCLEALLRHGDSIRDPQTVRPWCLTVLRNLLRQRLRRQSFRRLALMSEPPEAPADPWPEVTGRLAAEAWLQAVSEPRRQVAASFYLGGASIRRIAREQGRPEGTIKRWLHESREAITMALQRDGQARPRAYIYGTNWLDDARKALSQAAEAAGYEPVWEPLNEEGELPADAHLVVLGEHVAGRSGLELLLCIRATEATARTQVLLFGPARRTAMLAAWQAGADAYLTDPTSSDLPELLRKLGAAAGA